MGEPNERLIGGCLPAQCHHVPPFVSVCSVSAAGSFEVDVSCKASFRRLRRTLPPKDLPRDMEPEVQGKSIEKDNSRLPEAAGQVPC